MEKFRKYWSSSSSISCIFWFKMLIYKRTGEVNVLPCTCTHSAGNRAKWDSFNFLFIFSIIWMNIIIFFLLSLHQCREPGAEQKFKEISNAYEVKSLILITSSPPFRLQLWYPWTIECNKYIFWYRSCRMMKNVPYMTDMERLGLKVLTWAWG